MKFVYDSTPTFTIAGLTNTLSGSPAGMTFASLIQVLPSSLEINRTAIGGNQRAQWYQQTGTLVFSVTNDLKDDPYYVDRDGETEFSFNFTLVNWHKERPGTILNVDATLVFFIFFEAHVSKVF
jgi:hypothetical protein